MPTISIKFGRNIRPIWTVNGEEEKYWDVAVLTCDDETYELIIYSKSGREVWGSDAYAEDEAAIVFAALADLMSVADEITIEHEDGSKTVFVRK